MVAGDGAERAPRAAQVIRQPRRARVRKGCGVGPLADRPQVAGSGDHRAQGAQGAQQDAGQAVAATPRRAGIGQTGELAAKADRAGGGHGRLEVQRSPLEVRDVEVP